MSENTIATTGVSPTKTFYEWMEYASRRPAMYTGSYSIEALENFIRGYFFALDKKGIKEKNFPHFEWHFHQWIGGRLEVKYEFSWSRMLLNHCGQDNKKALKVFAELLQEFRQAQPVVSVVHLTARHWSFERHREIVRKPNYRRKVTPAYQEPVRIYRLRLPPSNTCWLIYMYSNNKIQETFNPFFSFHEAMKYVHSEYNTSALEWKLLSEAESEQFYRDVYVERKFEEGVYKIM